MSHTYGFMFEGKRYPLMDPDEAMDHVRLLNGYSWDDSEYIIRDTQTADAPAAAMHDFTHADLNSATASEYTKPIEKRETFGELIKAWHYPEGEKNVPDEAVANWGHISRSLYNQARREPEFMSPIFLMVACLYFYIPVETTKRMFCQCIGTDPLSAYKDTQILGAAIEMFLSDRHYKDDRSKDKAYAKFVGATSYAYAFARHQINLPGFLSRNKFWKAYYTNAVEDIITRGIDVKPTTYHCY